jgi:UDPglucose 6-dehydrogenase
MKIGIIGRGVVGDATYCGLAQIGNQVNHYDVNDKSTKIDDMSDRDIVFVCVPTEANDNGRCDTSIVENIISTLVSIEFSGIIAIKSTVIPGTTDALIKKHSSTSICYVPEFLREKSAHSDFFDGNDVLIIGSHDHNAAEKIAKAHKFIAKSVSIVKPIEAEISKYFNNVHNAMEITFANGVYEVCQQLGADYQEVLNAVGKRQNINTDYLKCSDFYRGYTGKCLPKDTQAWVLLTQDLGLDISLFESIIRDNRKYL